MIIDTVSTKRKKSRHISTDLFLLSLNVAFSFVGQLNQRFVWYIAYFKI